MILFILAHHLLLHLNLILQSGDIDYQDLLDSLFDYTGNKNLVFMTLSLLILGCFQFLLF